MHRSRFIFFMVLTLLLAACKKDDESDVVQVPPRALSEVEAEDDAAIKEYLQTHFYNYEEFESPPADFDYKIRLDTIAGANADKTALIDQVSSKTISVDNDEFALTAEETVDHTLYYLVAREGIGEHPTFADSVYVRYRGSLLNGTEFDGSFYVPDWFDLATIQGPLQGVRGFSEGVPYLKTGGAPTSNADGTFTVEDYGVGVIFLPSGLGYYNASQPDIPAYSPMIFEVELFALSETDHDSDGIPSFMEDLNGDGYLYNDNTDVEQERASGSVFRFMNYLDSDDDQDTTPTRDEIEIDSEGNITFPDTDNDGTPDYLDRDNP